MSTKHSSPVEPKEYVSQRQYAKMVGTSQTAVYKAVMTGRISEGWDPAKKKIIVSIANKEWGDLKKLEAGIDDDNELYEGLSDQERQYEMAVKNDLKNLAEGTIYYDGDNLLPEKVLYSKIKVNQHPIMQYSEINPDTGRPYSIIPIIAQAIRGAKTRDVAITILMDFQERIITAMQDQTQAAIKKCGYLLTRLRIKVFNFTMSSTATHTPTTKPVLIAIRCTGTVNGKPCRRLLGEFVIVQGNIKCGKCGKINELHTYIDNSKAARAP